MIQNSPPTIGVRGKRGAAKRKSFAVLPDLYHCLRKLNCETQIAIQTTTIVKAATPNKFLKLFLVQIVLKAIQELHQT